MSSPFSTSQTPGPPGGGWFPAAIQADELIWQFIGEAPFTDPFVHDTLRRHRQHPQQRTPLSALLEVNPKDSLPPAAFIFHASRCGSTLLTQMLASHGECRCLSEPPALDGLLARILRQPHGAENLPLLRGLVHAFGQPGEGVRHLILKHDSWHLAALPLMQEAFPGVPCWFLHRDPAAILRSHRRERGSQMVPGLHDLTPFGIQPEGIPPHDLDAYAIAVLTGIFRTAAVHIAAGSLLPLDATSLPAALHAAWLTRHGITASDAALRRMHHRASFHSKTPGQPWQPEPDLPPDNTAGLAELRALWHTFAP